MGAALGGSTRIDFVLEGEDTVSPKPRLVGKVLGIGTYRRSSATIDLLSAEVADTPDKIASTLRVVSTYTGSIGLAVIPPNSHCRNITRAAESRLLPNTLE